jgi:hypothetical protein
MAEDRHTISGLAPPIDSDTVPQALECQETVSLSTTEHEHAAPTHGGKGLRSPQPHASLCLSTTLFSNYKFAFTPTLDHTTAPAQCKLMCVTTGSSGRLSKAPPNPFHSFINLTAADAPAKALPPTNLSTSQQPPDCLLSEGECWSWPDRIAHCAAVCGVPCTAFEATDTYHIMFSIPL